MTHRSYNRLNLLLDIGSGLLGVNVPVEGTMY